MKRLSGPYRLFAVATLAAFAWAVALPVVHLACAMAMGASLPGYVLDGTSGDGLRDDGSSASACHRPEADPGTDSYPAYSVAGDVAAGCCVVETASIPLTATPASPAKSVEVNVPVADAPVPAPAQLGFVSALPIGSSPPPPAPQHILFSVLLI